MAWMAEFPSADLAQERAERALKLPLGLVSPLWAMFGAAAGAGVAYWWMTRWTQAANIEALAGVFAPPAPAEIAAAPAPVAESVPVVVAAPVAVAPVVVAPVYVPTCTIVSVPFVNAFTGVTYLVPRRVCN